MRLYFLMFIETLFLLTLSYNFIHMALNSLQAGPVLKMFGF